MNWPALESRDRRSRGGFTLVELLVAVTLTLVMMAAVVQIFAIVGRSINNSRASLEMADRLRATANRLRLDLEGATADMTPPLRPEDGKGYFEYIEGPIGPVDPAVVAAASPGFNTDESPPTPDSTVGDRDDILQFTTRSKSEPFVGRAVVITDDTYMPNTWGIDPNGPCDCYTTIVKSQVAEVAWFLRGTTLYRRVLLVSPSFDADLRTTSPDPHEAEVPYKLVYVRSRGMDDARILAGFYNNYDLSVHWDPNSSRVAGGVGQVVCNTLADLTRRECRYAHPPFRYDPSTSSWIDGFPYALHSLAHGNWYALGLPTLQECSHACWPFLINGRMPYQSDDTPAVILTNPSGLPFDAWVNPLTAAELDSQTGSLNLESLTPPLVNLMPPPAGYLPYPQTAVSPRYVGPRVGEDVILTNVLSFDVKAWDPKAPVLQAYDTVGASPIPNTAVEPGDTNYYAALLSGSAVLSRGAYVDLGYYPISPATAISDFSELPNPWSQLAVVNGPRVYDTWSTHYEHDGVDQNQFAATDGYDNNGDGSIDEAGEGSDGIADQGADGFDNNTLITPANGVVDDPDEREAPPPYDAPLRGIQVKIRVFEPDSRQVREVTIRHDFLKQ